MLIGYKTACITCLSITMIVHVYGVVVRRISMEILGFILSGRKPIFWLVNG